jgi:hypothetical protein
VECDRQEAALIDTHAGVDTGAPLVDRREHPISTCVAYILDIEVPSPSPRSCPRLKEPFDLLASVETFLRPSRDARHIPFDGLVDEPLSGAGIAAPRSQERLTHDLHVLLRNKPSSPPDHGPSLVHFIRRG